MPRWNSLNEMKALKNDSQVRGPTRTQGSLPVKKVTPLLPSQGRSNQMPRRAQQRNRKQNTATIISNADDGSISERRLEEGSNTARGRCCVALGARKERKIGQWIEDMKV